MIESLFALICGLVIGFVYSWRVSLIAIGLTPFLIIGGSANARL